MFHLHDFAIPSKRLHLTGIVGLVLVACVQAVAEDWPTYQHDNRRSGITAENLEVPLQEAWRYQASHPPRPAWPAPAKADMGNHFGHLNPMVTYDRAFHVVVAGDTAYFGSSADDKVYALDVSTGRVRWTFCTGGPVRLVPTVSDGKVYVGSDDGQVYCLDAVDGRLLWYANPFPEARTVIGHRRLISVSPIRTGVLVDDGAAYFCAGLFPLEGVRVCALDAQDGSAVWTVPADDLSPQGYLLASPTRLYMPQGRVGPCAYSRADGQRVLKFDDDRGGGAYALLADDATTLFNGPAPSGNVWMFEAGRPDRVAMFPGNRILVQGEITYLLDGTTLGALDRTLYLEVVARQNEAAGRVRTLGEQLRGVSRNDPSEEARTLRKEQADSKRALRNVKHELAKCRLWERPCEHSDSFILAGDTLFVGGRDEVVAHRASDGEPVWTGKVDGRAYGLAVANGRLLVSTDRGVVHSFSNDAPQPPRQPAMFSPRDDPEPASHDTANQMIDLAGTNKGFAVILGYGDGGLARGLARSTEMNVVCFDPDEAAVGAARKTLEEAGLYGVRVAVHRWPADPSRLPARFANLVVCTGVTGEAWFASSDDVHRLVRPHGGTAVAFADTPANLEAWTGPEWTLDGANGLRAVLKRGPVPGGRPWSHMYADATNSACNYDKRAEVPAQLQWFGRPGPRKMVDRHHRNMAPLSADGRLFAVGDNHLFAIDAYNGAPIWDLELPGSIRLGAPFDSPNMAVSDNGKLYLAIGEACHVFDTATGNHATSLPVPQLIENQTRQWGYTAIVRDRLYGSGTKPDAPYTAISYQGDLEQWGDFKPLVTSDYLFCMDRDDGKVRWTHHGRLIINPAIAIGGGRLYLVESLDPELSDGPTGRIPVRDLLAKGGAIVALDSATGEKRWEVQPDLSPFTQIIFLSYANEILLASGSRNIEGRLWHVLHAFDARTGQLLWTREGNTGWRIAGGHGEQTRHPAIVGDTIYAEPHAYLLATGEPKPGWRPARDGGGCGTFSASASILFFRDKNPAACDLETNQPVYLNRVSRTGCWINIIPAGGMILVPEASSGCSCPFPLQTSFGYIPVSLATP